MLRCFANGKMIRASACELATVRQAAGALHGFSNESARIGFNAVCCRRALALLFPAGTFAYVSAGTYGKALLEGGAEGAGAPVWQVRCCCCTALCS